VIERLEVTAGAGTVIRFGYVAAWTGPNASPGLVSFLAESARNLAASPTSGEHLADHLAGVLARRDPEPDVAFAVVGPGEHGWAVLLHAAVQIWDGRDWTVTGLERPWLRTTLFPAPALAVSAVGTPAPPLSPDTVLDMQAGVVPGGGFVMVPAGAGRGESLVLHEARPESRGTAAEDTAVLVAPDSPPATEVIAAVTPPPAPVTPSAAPTGLLDLRAPEVLARVVAYPALPPGGAPSPPTAGAPVVAGVACRRGHLNRPGMGACARCGGPVGAEESAPMTGTRPALGCLITDGGGLFRLDSGYLIGSDPADHPTVRGRLARPLELTGEGVAADHAEIRLHDWDVVVTDHGAEGGTFLFGPRGAAWERLRPYEPRTLDPGTHLAFAQRVLTFVTPWAAPGPAPRPAGPSDQETRSRN
jgi:hypothetical protein